MKTFAFAVVWGVLLSGGLAAGPIYRINFTGTVTSGTAKDFNLIDNTTEKVADLAGVVVSGWMDFDLGAAPVPAVSVDGSGFTNTLIQSIGCPIFVSEHFVIEGFTPPGADFLPLTGIFDLAPIPSLPSGTSLTQIQDFQSLQFSTKPVLGPQTVLPQMNLAFSWTGPQLSGGDTVALDLLISSPVNGPHFFPVPPPGDLPSSWGPVTTGNNGLFTFAQLFQNPMIADHFGIITNYSVSGGFTLDSASGGFLPTPEPGTLALSAAGLLLAAALRFKVRP